MGFLSLQVLKIILKSGDVEEGVQMTSATFLTLGLQRAVTCESIENKGTRNPCLEFGQAEVEI